MKALNTNRLFPDNLIGLVRKAKEFGFSDVQIAKLLGKSEAEIHTLRQRNGIVSSFRTVDTCAAEFEAFTPYLYASYENENESTRSAKKKVVILGGGPNRIGQGIEFDYCCVHGLFALHESGYEAIMVNCNPETVSTDYDVADKLYFEPLTFEDVIRVLELEQPDGVIVSFGGQTPLKLAKQIVDSGFHLLGTQWDGIDLAEDREKFGHLLSSNQIVQPRSGNARTEEEAVMIAREIGYPILLRPSYVLGGRGMHILYSENSLLKVIRQAIDVSESHPVLIDQYLEDALEFDVDVLSDGSEVIVAGILQHIEEAGIHSGDSTCIIPAAEEVDGIASKMVGIARHIARSLKVVGFLNIQFAVQGNRIYVLEANPRASRTIPFICKATGIPFVKHAVRLMLGMSCKEIPVGSAIPKFISIKKAVFPWIKMRGASSFLGPEMRSTGEVMGIGADFGEAIVKAQLASGATLPTNGSVFLSLNEVDKNDRTLAIARDFLDSGFQLIATTGTSHFLGKNGIPSRKMMKVHEGRPDIVDEIKNGNVQLIVNTPLGEISRFDESAIGKAAIEYGIPMLSNISAAAALIIGIRQAQQRQHGVRNLQEIYQK